MTQRTDTKPPYCLIVQTIDGVMHWTTFGLVHETLWAPELYEDLSGDDLCKLFQTAHLWIQNNSGEHMHLPLLFVNRFTKEVKAASQLPIRKMVKFGCFQGLDYYTYRDGEFVIEDRTGPFVIYDYSAKLVEEVIQHHESVFRRGVSGKLDIVITYEVMPCVDV